MRYGRQATRAQLSFRSTDVLIRVLSDSDRVLPGLTVRQPQCHLHFCKYLKRGVATPPTAPKVVFEQRQSNGQVLAARSEDLTGRRSSS